MSGNSRSLIYLVYVVLVTTACASSRPVLYPNPQLQSVGRTVADHDINECMRLANEAGLAEGKGEKVATNAAGNATVGGAAGAAAGAVHGRVGRGAAAGAAAAGAASVTRGALQSNEPDNVYKAFVNKCLRDRGYEPIGWK